MFLRPFIIIEDITQLDLDRLKAQGIQGFIFDLDNTLMAPHAGILDAKMQAWLATLKVEGFQCVVVSNNKRAQYVQAVEKVLDFPIIGNAKKPRRKYLRQALRMMNLMPQQIAVVGDRPLTDIWGGQRLGAFTILVDPLTKHKEGFLIKCLRKLERFCVKSC